MKINTKKQYDFLNMVISATMILLLLVALIMAMITAKKETEKKVILQMKSGEKITGYIGFSVPSRLGSDRFIAIKVNGEVRLVGKKHIVQVFFLGRKKANDVYCIELVLVVDIFFKL